MNAGAFPELSRREQFEAIDVATLPQLAEIEAYYRRLGYTERGQALTRIAVRRAWLTDGRIDGALAARARSIGLGSLIDQQRGR